MLPCVGPDGHGPRRTGIRGSRRQTRRTLVAGWLIVASIAGCSANSSPPSPTTLATMIPPGFGESTLPVMPSAARLESRDGALAYVAYYVKRVNAGARRADATPAATLAAESCDGCRDLAAELGTVMAGGAALTSDYWTFEKGSLHSRRGHLWALLVSINQDRQDSLDSAGRVIASVPERHLRVLFTLEFNGSWRVTELQVQ